MDSTMQMANPAACNPLALAPPRSMPNSEADEDASLSIKHDEDGDQGGDDVQDEKDCRAGRRKWQQQSVPMCHATTESSLTPTQFNASGSQTCFQTRCTPATSAVDSIPLEHEVSKPARPHLQHRPRLTSSSPATLNQRCSL